tara:strand:- start:3523 stop:4329 length:807 start_codon:yes stop_codon:yes gene_type:complete
MRKLINIKRSYRVISSILSSQYALMLEYRAEIILWALSGLLPLFMLAIWQDADVLSKLDLSRLELRKYFISAFLVRQFTAIWVIFLFERDNIEGRLSPLLLQPVNPFWRYYFSHIAEQLTRLPFVIFFLTLLILFIPELNLTFDIFNVLLSILVILSTFTIRFLMHWLFSMACFWTDRASAVERLLLIPYVFLSGLVAPLEAYPESIQNFSRMTPYPYLIAFPSKVLMGDFTYLSIFFKGIIIWGVVFFILSKIIWKLGLKKYSAMGS